MPRAGSIPTDIADFLKGKPKGATIEEIVAGLNKVRRFEVLRHSVRSALYQHLDGKGERLFVRLDRSRYALRK